MRIAGLLLVLSFASFQSLCIIDCPCGSLCAHKNDCSSAGEEAPQDDCCRQSRAAAGPPVDAPHQKPCFHLEPQTDVDGLTLDQAPAPELIWILDPVPSLEFVWEAVLPFHPSGLSPPGESPPLYLQHAALLL